jgi:hypothetical protein
MGRTPYVASHYFWGRHSFRLVEGLQLGERSSLLLPLTFRTPRRRPTTNCGAA